MKENDESIKEGRVPGLASPSSIIPLVSGMPGDGPFGGSLDWPETGATVLDANGSLEMGVAGGSEGVVLTVAAPSEA